MQITTHMFGKILGVRKVELDGFDNNGDWKQAIPKTEVTVMSESIDSDGQPTYSMDKHTFESTQYNRFLDLKDKYVAVPYKLQVDGKKQKWELDTSMPILELSSNPLISEIKKNTTK